MVLDTDAHADTQMTSTHTHGERTISGYRYGVGNWAADTSVAKRNIAMDLHPRPVRVRGCPNACPFRIDSKE